MLHLQLFFFALPYLKKCVKRNNVKHVLFVYLNQLYEVILTFNAQWLAY